jgi:hypothetical protein
MVVGCSIFNDRQKEKNTSNFIKCSALIISLILKIKGDWEGVAGTGLGQSPPSHSSRPVSFLHSHLIFS